MKQDSITLSIDLSKAKIPTLEGQLEYIKEKCAEAGITFDQLKGYLKDMFVQEPVSTRFTLRKDVGFEATLIRKGKEDKDVTQCAIEYMENLINSD